MDWYASLSIIAVGALVAASAGMVGCFLVLRRLALLGDAISHAVLPGIALAFLLTGSRGTLIMVLGAGALGILTTFLVQSLQRAGVQEDAGIGVSFTALFAIGVVLVSLFAGKVDLDLDCVLYGEIAYTPWDTLVVGGINLGPESVWIMGGIFLLVVAVIGAFYKELKICAFDPAMAAAVGINVALVHYLLMGLVSVTTVGAFESVGAILVVAMMIVPAATAYLLTERLGTMLVLAAAQGVVSAVLGYFVARHFDSSIAAAMTTVSGALFTLAFLFAPRTGVVARALAHRGLRQESARGLRV
ncbi:MAG: ABC-type Mn2+/Zn2+ transport system, permease [Symbiobacteriaceae bacterium]|nr:ABC-type Mn2+/Zn2+ transport system, permease [Symbiobacteriaceae bacterium]